MPLVTRFICDKCMVEGIEPEITLQLDAKDHGYAYLKINGQIMLAEYACMWVFCSKTCATAWLLEKLRLTEDGHTHDLDHTQNLAQSV